uniref:CCHC-type domain-containing protein n=1 Tax=Brassica oleracea var. oleracea TaxID=109376 RepID=A0A0D3DJ07_BRAOL
MSVRIPLFSCSVRSTSFHLHRRLSRRRLPPASMAKKKPLKKLPHRRSPTGKDQTSANLSISTPKSTPKVPLAVQKQSSTSTPATVEKELAIPDAHTASYEPAMAIQTDSPKSETLATVTKYVPSCPKEKTPEGIAAASTTTPNHTATSADIWKGFVKNRPHTQRLKPKETPYLLDFSEACVTIPNAVVERNMKAWENFIIGQFYEEPPARDAVQAIVNGIWSRERRDITVSKMDGNAFLFRVPCPNARRRILNQSLWQIDGQTMFVAKWAPGLQQTKPELDMEIAGIVGHPVCLHPTTENLTNIEVAKVYTIIDPRKKIPEFVNARFESGETKRIAVSTPWMPSLCSYCNRVGHTITHCKSAPRTCTSCNSVRHTTEQCPRGKAGISGDRVAIAGGRAVATRSSAEIARGRAEVARGKQHVKSLLPTVTKTKAVYVPVNSTETPPQDRRHPISPSGRKLSSLSIMEDTVDNLALTFGSPPAKTALETETIGRFNEHCKFRKQLCLRY